MSNTGEHLKPVDLVLECSKLVIVCVLENTEFLQLFLRAKTCKSEGQVVFQSRGVPDTYEKDGTEEMAYLSWESILLKAAGGGSLQKTENFPILLTLAVSRFYIFFLSK